MATTFTYDVALDFPGGKCNLARLAVEIARSPSVTTALADGGVASSGSAPVADVVSAGVVVLTFKADLPDADQAALDGSAGLPHGTHPAGGLIAAHDATPTPAQSQPVTVQNVPDVQVSQGQKSNGHYRMVPLVIPGIPAGATRYNDLVVSDYPKGLDWHNAHFYAGDADSGDQIVAAKLLVGKVAAVAAAAAQGDTSLQVAGPAYVLAPTASGGAIDEGFWLSFGTENSSAAAINGVQGGPPGTGTLSNPEGELVEYEIYSIGPQVPLGGGNVVVTITFFQPLVAAIQQGADVNLVIRGVPDPLPITKNDTIDIGGDVLTAGNMPSGSVLRFGYQNVGAAVKTVRAVLTTLY